MASRVGLWHPPKQREVERAFRAYANDIIDAAKAAVSESAEACDLCGSVVREIQDHIDGILPEEDRRKP